MNLIIENKDKLDLNSFTSWLLDIIKKYFVDYCDYSKLNKFNGEIWQKYTINNIDKWFYEIIDNLQIKSQNNNYIIQINPYKQIEGISLINLAKFINYGNLNNRGYPIFTQVFNYFSDNLQDFYNLYNNEQNIVLDIDIDEDIEEE